MMIITGTKYYNKNEIIRVITNMNDHKINPNRILVKNEITGEIKVVDKEDLYKKYIMLIPAGYIKFSLLKKESYLVDSFFLTFTQNINSYLVNLISPMVIDVFNAFYINGLDYKACYAKDRTYNEQDVASEIIQYSLFNDEDALYHTEAIKEDNEYYEFTNTIEIAYYIDDTVEGTILSLIPDKYIKKYNESISKAAQLLKRDGNITLHHMNTINDLFKQVVLQTSIDLFFNIQPMLNIKFKAVTDNEYNTLYLFSKNDMITLSGFVLGEKLKNYMILKYWYDIDLSDIKYKHQLVRDSTTGTLFVVLYQHAGYDTTVFSKALDSNEYYKFMKDKY